LVKLLMIPIVQPPLSFTLLTEDPLQHLWDFQDQSFNQLLSRSENPSNDTTSINTGHLASLAEIQDFGNRLKRQYAQEQSTPPPPIGENESQRDNKRTRPSSLFDEMLISAGTNPSVQAPFTGAPVSLVAAHHMSQLVAQQQLAQQQLQMMGMANPGAVFPSGTAGIGQASGGLGIPLMGGSMCNTPLISLAPNPMASLGRNAKEPLRVPISPALASGLMDGCHPKAIASKGKGGGGKNSLKAPKETMKVVVGVKTEMFEDGNAYFHTFTLVAPPLTEAFPISRPFSVFCLSFFNPPPPLPRLWGRRWSRCGSWI
jgi:hypothetical protein